MKAPQTSSTIEPLPELQTSFAGGMRDRDHPSLLDPNQYAYSSDIEVRDAGLAKMRGGRTTKTNAIGGNPQGGFWYKDNSGNEYLVTINSGKFYYWQGSGLSVTQIGATTLGNTTENVGHAVLNGRAFIACGNSDNTYSWTGTGALTDEGNTNADSPRCKLFAQQSGRIVSGGEAAPNQDYIRFSDIFDGQTWDRSNNNKRVPTDGSEEVKGLATYRKEEILSPTPFSSHSWNVSGSTVASFSRLQLDTKVGSIAPRTLTVVSDDAFFLSADIQLRTIKRTEQDLAFNVSLPITYFVPQLMARITPGYAGLCTGIYFNNYYLLAAPLDGAMRNSGVIAFDLLHQFPSNQGSIPVCVAEWTNMAVNEFIVTYFGGIARLHYVDANDGSIKQMFDNSTTDDGTTITPQIDFRAFGYGDANLKKTAHSGELQFVNSSGTATLYYKKDDGQWNSIGSSAIGDTSANLPVSLPFSLPPDSGISPWLFPMYGRGRSKYWQLRLTFTGSSMNLKQATLRSFVENFTTR